MTPLFVQLPMVRRKESLTIALDFIGAVMPTSYNDPPHGVRPGSRIDTKSGDSYLIAAPPAEVESLIARALEQASGHNKEGTHQ